MTSTNDLPPIEAYDGSDPYLFISYSHLDSTLVFPEILYLHDQGYRIWYDEGIDPGNEWPDTIAKALKGASQFLVFVSNHAVDSKHVCNEIHFALNHNKSFFAIHIEDTVLPVGLELRMGDIQAIFKYRLDTARYQKQLKKVIKESICKKINQCSEFSTNQLAKTPLLSQSTPNPQQPVIADKKTGRNDDGTRMLKKLIADQDLYIQMLKERTTKKWERLKRNARQ